MLFWTQTRPGPEYCALTCPIHIRQSLANSRRATTPRKLVSETTAARRDGKTTQCSASASTPAESSFDAEDDLDSGPSQELAKYDVERFRQQSQHLELMWRIQRVGKNTCRALAGWFGGSFNPSYSDLCRGLLRHPVNAARVPANETAIFAGVQVR